MARHTGKFANPAFSVGSYAGGRVMQAAYGTHTMPAGTAANDVVAITKLPSGAQVLRATAYNDGVEIANAKIGIDGDNDAYTNVAAPVDVVPPAVNPNNSGKTDVTVIYTATGTEVAAGDVLYVIVEYVYEQPRP